MKTVVGGNAHRASASRVAGIKTGIETGTSGTETGPKPQRHPQRRSSPPSPTKIRISANDDAPRWRSLLRDVLTAFVPLLVLYQLAAHPGLNDLGRRDPRAPETGNELLALLAWRRRQRELHDAWRFREAMEEGRRCHDFPTVEMPAKKRKRSRGGAAGRRPRTSHEKQSESQGTQTKGNQGNGRDKGKRKKKFRRGRALSGPSPSAASSPSASPWSERISSAFRPPPAAGANKGTESKPSALADRRPRKGEGIYQREKRKRFGAGGRR